MAEKWIDLSISLHPDMTVWPGDASFEFLPDRRIAAGSSCNTSQIRQSTHTGTHVDAPWHFEESGRHLDEVDTDLFFGEALLIDLPDVERITASDLPVSPLPPRVLFKTKNSVLPVDAPFIKDFVAVELDAAKRLVADGVKLVGVDYLSVAPFKQPDATTHHCLLENNVFVVEGLRLGALQNGMYEFIVLPLPIIGADGAPCRAFARSKEKVE